MMRNLAISILLSLAGLPLMPGCSDRQQPNAAEGEQVAGELIIFHAGSLAVPFKEIAAAFTSEYPHVKVFREVAGSRSCARKITDLGMPCDVLALADYTVINELVIPEHADWLIKFATNEMVLAYSDRSRQGDRIDANNWFEILARDDVAFGRSDPNTDPCGYRAVLTIKLAEKHYASGGLADRLLAKDRRYIRPKETDLPALLEVGEIDYIFIYRSVAEQHRLKFLRLPGEINLGSADFADFYAAAGVRISGRTPGSFITKRGGEMLYGVTIPNNATNKAAAMAFVKFLLDENKGLAIMRKHGQGSTVPAPTDTFEKIPQSLRRFARNPT